MLPFYPGEEGSLSFNSNIVLDGSTPHIREIYFAGANDATYQGGDVVQVTTSCMQKSSFATSTPVHLSPSCGHLLKTPVTECAILFNYSKHLLLFFRLWTSEWVKE